MSLPSRTGAAAVRAPRIQLEGAAFGWGGQMVVGPLSGAFEPGSMTAIVGHNGAGKSTLLKGIMGMPPPLSGSIHIGQPGRRALAWLPQAAELDRGFPITVFDMVAMGAWRRVGAWRGFGRQEIARVHAALEEVGIVAHAHASLQALSGGQLQRALFARLLLQDAPVLLLDEPFTSVDAQTTEALMAVLRRLHAQGRTVIAVLHDLALARRDFPRTLMLPGAPNAVSWADTARILREQSPVPMSSLLRVVAA